MTKTIRLDNEEIWKELQVLKIAMGYINTEEVVKRLIQNYNIQHEEVKYDEGKQEEERKNPFISQ